MGKKSRENTKEEVRRMTRERKKRKRRERRLQKERLLLSDLQGEKDYFERQRKICDYMSRKYYDRLNSLLRREEAPRNKSVVEEPKSQRKVLAIRTHQFSLEIDRGLLEQPKDESGKEHKLHLGSGVFGCCSKMFYRGVPVAVKTFHSSTAEEVKREARVISNLKHPNFPLLLGICTLSKPYLLVTSYYNISDRPYTLSSLLKSKSLSLSEHVWLTLIRQLAQAISYLHDTGYIHRDIKGDNVLVSLLNSEHRAILIDFGKCIHLSAAGNHLKHLTPLEQKKYHQKHGHIAPEIVSGASPPSFASDIYSFGQLVYAVGTFIDHHFLRALGKRCCHDDATMRPELNHIVDELKVPVQVVSD
ncbi:probable serine/threonine-protein kinase DDB_G0271682 [Montipora capricornis]|uniref:probable serine/threonine-protein kinase DDB_G0271682 n=1 Tax=Montipora capricornis TaxID=246305 RepID=UPI0035F15462